VNPTPSQLVRELTRLRQTSLSSRFEHFHSIGTHALLGRTTSALHVAPEADLRLWRKADPDVESIQILHRMPDDPAGLLRNAKTPTLREAIATELEPTYVVACILGRNGNALVAQAFKQTRMTEKDVQVIPPQKLRNLSPFSLARQINAHSICSNDASKLVRFVLAVHKLS